MSSRSCTGVCSYREEQRAKTWRKKAAATAGKYMVASRGNLREMMFSTGIKFTEDFVMMANDYDMQIDEYPDKNVKS